MSDPSSAFRRCQLSLARIVEIEGAEIFASNHGEAYLAFEHHYGFSNKESRWGLAQVLHSGFFAPRNGRPFSNYSKPTGEQGLLGRLIADDYRHQNCVTLTLDHRMAKLRNVQML